MSTNKEILDELLQLFGFRDDDKPDYIDMTLKNYSQHFEDTETTIIFQVYRSGFSKLIACNNAHKYYKTIFSSSSTKYNNKKRLEKFNEFIASNYEAVHA